MPINEVNVQRLYVQGSIPTRGSNFPLHQNVSEAHPTSQQSDIKNAFCEHEMTRTWSSFTFIYS